MKTTYTYQKLVSSIVFLMAVIAVNAQSLYIPADSAAPDILTYTLSGGTFQDYGCDGLDPTYWISGNGKSVTATFVNVQENPSFRVWGMNDDDTAELIVNGLTYPLSTSSASYDTKVICSTIYGSPGPDGVLFSSGLLVGANTNSEGNYSYQNVTIQASSINSFTLIGLSGAGWGIAGVTINDQATAIISNKNSEANVNVFPNPTFDTVTLTGIEYSDVSIDVFSVLGELILQENHSGDKPVTINLEHIQQGAYIMVINSEHGAVTKKIIKQ